MSKSIDLTQPLSDEDREWLESRADVSALAKNAAYMAGAEFSSSDLAVDPLVANSLEQSTDQPPADDAPKAKSK